jgi:hypothetical protein
MDEVSNGSPVGSVPIGTEDVQDWSGTCENSRDDWNEIAGLLSWVFTQDTGLVTADLRHPCQRKAQRVLETSTYRVEVSQRCNGPRRI